MARDFYTTGWGREFVCAPTIPDVTAPSWHRLWCSAVTPTASGAATAAIFRFNHHRSLRPGKLHCVRPRRACITDSSLTKISGVGIVARCNFRTFLFSVGGAHFCSWKRRDCIARSGNNGAQPIYPNRGRMRIILCSASPEHPRERLIETCRHIRSYKMN